MRSIAGEPVRTKKGRRVHTATGERFATLYTRYAVRTICGRYLNDIADYEPDLVVDCPRCL